MRSLHWSLTLLTWLWLATQTLAADWPQFLGPTRNGVYPGQDLAKSWPSQGPPVRWQTKTGAGFSGPVVASGKLILFHRVADKETVDCLDAKTGTKIWSYDYPTRYEDDFGFDQGPRATPAVAGARVFVHGAEGMLHALDLNTGRKLWQVDTKKEFRAEKGFFGIASSPLVEGQAVLLNVGGEPNAGIVAFDQQQGTVLWKQTSYDASYASPVAADIRGRRYGLVLTRSTLVAVDPPNGRMLFEFPFTPTIRSSVTAATPLVIEDRIFISASYGAGAVMLKVGEKALEKVWENDQLANHYATSVYHEGHLYGIHGRVDPGMNPALRCVDARDGKVRWEQQPFEAAILIKAGDQLLILTERGELIRAAASPLGFKPNARAQILPAPTRAHPALANGLFYARSPEKLVCVDLSAAAPR